MMRSHSNLVAAILGGIIGNLLGLAFFVYVLHTLGMLEVLVDLARDMLT